MKSLSKRNVFFRVRGLGLRVSGLPDDQAVLATSDVCHIPTSGTQSGQSIVALYPHIVVVDGRRQYYHAHDRITDIPRMEDGS